MSAWTCNSIIWSQIQRQTLCVSELHYREDQLNHYKLKKCFQFMFPGPKGFFSAVYTSTTNAKSDHK